MTYTDDCTLPGELLELIAAQGFDALPDLIRIVINAAMQAERQKYLRAAPFEHADRLTNTINRSGYYFSFKRYPTPSSVRI